MVKRQYNCKFCENIFDDNRGFKTRTKECTEICHDILQFDSLKGTYYQNTRRHILNTHLEASF